MTREIVLASGNAGKLREFQQLLGGLDLRVRPQSEFAVPEVEETGLSFVENALLKARAAAAHSGLPAIADDSGLEVDALQGRPGIYSARFAGPGASDADNNRKLLSLLTDVPESARSARFRCLLVYMRHAEDPMPIICLGTWEGCIGFEPRGDNGFGYDPLFYIPALNCCSAELAPEQKNRLSHRGQAMAQLLAAISAEAAKEGVRHETAG